MIRYYDSSILLAAVLEQTPPDLIPSLWEPTQIRLTSVLSKIECTIGVRRAGLLQKLAPDGPWCAERIRLLDSYLDELECKWIDDDIHDMIRRTPSLANCRSLDAIHVATMRVSQSSRPETRRAKQLSSWLVRASGVPPSQPCPDHRSDTGEDRLHQHHPDRGGRSLHRERRRTSPSRTTEGPGPNTQF